MIRASIRFMLSDAYLSGAEKAEQGDLCVEATRGLGATIPGGSVQVESNHVAACRAAAGTDDVADGRRC